MSQLTLGSDPRPYFSIFGLSVFAYNHEKAFMLK